MSYFDDFQKTKEYLFCVDSDGCVMDTMNAKHFHCFGPLLVEEWALEQWQEEVLRRWNEINLYRMTRGINRFRALAMILVEIDEKYTPIIGVRGFQVWAESAPVLSNEGLLSALEQTRDEDTRLCMRKALLWSIAVNDSINRLPEELKPPYAGASESIRAAHRFADVAMVSSANRDAVLEEWEKFDLLEHTDIVLTQDAGSKIYCINRLLEYGYDPHKVIMIGDAAGDLEAAEKTGIRFYPILVNWEEESWTELYETVLDQFHEGTYGRIQEFKIQVFKENLGE